MTNAAVSQKLSQQYSRQRRERSATSRADSFCLRHSADQPASPRAWASHSDFENGLPCGTALVAQPDPGEMEIFVEQHAPVLPGMPF